MQSTGISYFQPRKNGYINKIITRIITPMPRCRFRIQKSAAKHKSLVTLHLPCRHVKQTCRSIHKLGSQSRRTQQKHHQPDQGPALIFVTLPNVFVNMTGGRIWGTLFFLFMTFASFSTVIAVFENLVAFLTDTFGMSRTKASIINGIIMFFACLPCIFGFNIWSDFNILGKGVLDLEDFVVSNLLLPIGAMVYLLFCTTKFGWGFDNYFEECNTGKGLKLSRVLKPYLKYALPVLIVIVFVQGFIG